MLENVYRQVCACLSRHSFNPRVSCHKLRSQAGDEHKVPDGLTTHVLAQFGDSSRRHPPFKLPSAKGEAASKRFNLGFLLNRKDLAHQKRTKLKSKTRTHQNVQPPNLTQTTIEIHSSKHSRSSLRSTFQKGSNSQKTNPNYKATSIASPHRTHLRKQKKTWNIHIAHPSAQDYQHPPSLNEKIKWAQVEYPSHCNAADEAPTPLELQCALLISGEGSATVPLNLVDSGSARLRSILGKSVLHVLSVLQNFMFLAHTKSYSLFINPKTILVSKILFST